MNKYCTHCSKIINKPVHNKTLNPFCNAICYGLWQKGKVFLDQGKPARKKLSCKIQDCEVVHFGKGYCRKHYVAYSYQPKPKEKTLKYVEPKPLINCKTCNKLFSAKHKNPIYCSMACSSNGRKKPFIIKKNYKKVLEPLHHRADKKGYVFEHIIVAEKTIGRLILKGEEVHHIDHNSLNNAPENLQVFSSHVEHMKAHLTPLNSIL